MIHKCLMVAQNTLQDFSLRVLANPTRQGVQWARAERVWKAKVSLDIRMEKYGPSIFSFSLKMEIIFILKG